MKSIEILIDSKGEIRLQTHGYAGSECKAASAPIEKALGLVQSHEPTAEWFATSPLTLGQQTTRS